MWFQARSKTSTTPPLRGVNLGGWLVLEKWITPSLFAGTSAIDEYTFCELADAKQRKRLQRHRETFVTEADFVWIAERSLDAVRVPIGYWLFGDTEPYQNTQQFLDSAFAWADKHGIKVLLSIHGAPGSQNGQDHSGRSGALTWHQDKTHVLQTLRFVQQLTEAYKASPALWGIELLNEPSPKLSKKILKKYYEDAYEIIRAQAGENVAIVFSDGFRPRHWKRVLREPKFSAYIDTHQYQLFTDNDRRMDAGKHLLKTSRDIPKALTKMQKFHHTIVGEWSAALDEQSLKGLTEVQKRAFLKAYANAQLLAYEQTAGWFYWTYKTEDSGPWNFRANIEAGLLPGSFSV